MHGNSNTADGNGSVPVRDLYPVWEVALLLGDISTRHVWKLIKRGELSAVRIGTRRLVPRGAIDKYLEKLKEEAAA